MHGTCARGRLLLFYGVVRVLKDAPPPFNFEVLGVGLAEGDPDHPPLRPLRGPLGWRVVSKGAPSFGAWVLQADMGVTEGFDYIFGTRPEGFTNRCFVARVPHGEEADPAAWRFFDGRDWSPEVARAAPIFDDVPGELSVEWNAHLRRFVAVHALGLSREVVARGSDRPEGPWSAPTLLARIPPPMGGDPGFVYAAKQQPAMRPTTEPMVLWFSAVDSRRGVPDLWRVVFP